MEKLNWTKMMNDRMKACGWSTEKLARQTGMTYTGAWHLLKRNDIHLQKVAELSEVFQYNFFRELADGLTYSAPATAPSAELLETKAQLEAKEAENASLQARVKELELELKVLKEAISLLRAPVA